MSVNRNYGAPEEEGELQTGRFKTQFPTHEVVGKGTFGSVFRVERAMDKAVFAVKKMSMESSKVKKNLNEVRKLETLRHPGVVRYYGWWKENPDGDDLIDIYIQMEFCNESLEQWLTRHNNEKPRDQNQIRSWFKQIVSAIKYIHEQNIIHRDLKPGNILVSSDEVVKICDLGIATDCVLESESKTRTHIGTSLYMAPEQMFYYSEKVDVFSIGLVLIELCKAMTESERTKVFGDIHCAKQLRILQDEPSTLDLVKQLTTLDWEARPSVDDIYDHSFFNNEIGDVLNIQLAAYSSRYAKEFTNNAILGTSYSSYVFAATNFSDGKKYAVKRIFVEARDRSVVEILQEIRLMQLNQLDHPGIVRNIDTWMEQPPKGWQFNADNKMLRTVGYTGNDANMNYYCNDCVFIYVQMQKYEYSLAQWMETDKKYGWRRKEEMEKEKKYESRRADEQCTRPIPKIKSLFKQIVAAVGYLHENNLVHKNLKPSNILFDGSNQLKICDLGIDYERRNCGQTTMARSDTDDFYKSPENYMSFPFANYTSMSDVFSLGLILVELYLIITPAERNRIFRKYWLGRQFRHINDAETEKFVAWLTHFDPKNRPTCRQMLDHAYLA
ncbi:hypothetical protein PENTCL1PPCAC_8323 [Pristionchus entomophagus]|uniref:Protein kinase domain-containing protein n=1 Tax=Pristionchus entomophagus TaxID=358040 RepID=A0AAV5SSM4_9BILA|nr:hypothetical protein PENTCL1PPCAC_8323 [Pristionchus entomophagus]